MMKKILAVCMAAACMMIHPFGASAAEVTVSGDANGNGYFEFGDILNLKSYLLCETDTLENAEAADMNSDGKLDARDLTLMKRDYLAAEDVSRFEKGTLVRVVDGDTYCIDLNSVDGDEEKGTKVRIIGVDTPESVAPSDYRKDNTEEGKTVSEIVKSTWLAGDTVYLEYDVSDTDRYGRTLAYVYLHDGTMAEQWLLKNGYANVATYAPNVKYADYFAALAHEAAENKVGLWNGFFEE